MILPDTGERVMFRQLVTSLSVITLCLAPLTASAGGPFQKSAIQKAAVQKAPMPVVQKAPIHVAQKAPLGVFQKAPSPVFQKGPLSVFQKTPVIAQKSLVPVSACSPPIRYMQRRPCKRTCCGCTSSIQTVLQVQDPRACTPCPVMVPVCLPACCVGTPQVTTMVGLLGRGNVCYKWCCGYRVKVVFDNRGGIIVNYFGS
jgi:hypothetical protein